MENKSHPAVVIPKSWSISATRMRKDIFKKPSQTTALVHVNWDGDPPKAEMTLTLDLTIREKNEARPIELAFVSLEVICDIKGIDPNNATAIELPTEVMVRIGQKASDMAFGIVLAKSVGTALQGLDYPEVPLHVFLPPPFPQFMMN